jgi:hypothetical protein
VILFDTLRPPSPIDSSAPAYKDWFHLNFADPLSGTIGLINLSLHGAPWDERSRALGTILIHSSDTGWASYVENLGYSEANLGSSVVALRDVALAIDERAGVIHASASGFSNPFHGRISAELGSEPMDLEQRMPLGSGWISWCLVQNMSLSGEWSINDRPTTLIKVPAYHDHNWGRWNWGDDFGWEFGCFLRDPHNLDSPSLVFACTTDRSHQHRGMPFLLADSGSARRRFSAENIKLELGGQFDLPLHRIPGAMAALHPEMAEPRLPRTVEIRALQGSDYVSIFFIARAAAQFVTADPGIRGYSFIHEMVGEYVCSGKLLGLPFAGKGYAVFEYVE